MIISEHRLHGWASCPARAQQEPEGLDPLREAAEKTIEVALVRRFGGMDVSATAIRPVMEANLMKQLGDKAQLAKVMVQGAKFAKHLADFLASYKVVAPTTPYQLDIPNGHRVEGRYAVVQAVRHSHEKMMALMVWDRRPPISSQKPDATSLARWLHLSARQGIEVGVCHFSLLGESIWRTHPQNPALARQYVSSMLESIARGLVFASPGLHCEHCVNKPCEQVYEPLHQLVSVA